MRPRTDKQSHRLAHQSSSACTPKPRPRCARPGPFRARLATRSIADPVAPVFAANPIAAAGDRGTAQEDRADGPATVAPAAREGLGIGGGGGRERSGGDGGDGGNSEDGLAEHGVSPFCYWMCSHILHVSRASDPSGSCAPEENTGVG